MRDADYDFIYLCVLWCITNVYDKYITERPG